MNVTKHSKTQEISARLLAECCTEQMQVASLAAETEKNSWTEYRKYSRITATVVQWGTALVVRMRRYG